MGGKKGGGRKGKEMGIRRGTRGEEEDKQGNGRQRGWGRGS